MLAGYFPCCASCKGAGGRRGAHPINSHPLFQPLPRPKKHTPAPQTAKLTSLALFREGSGFLQPPSPRILTYLLFSFFSPSVLFRISAAAAEASYCSNGREGRGVFSDNSRFPPPSLPPLRQNGWRKEKGDWKRKKFQMLLLCGVWRVLWQRRGWAAAAAMLLSKKYLGNRLRL